MPQEARIQPRSPHGINRATRGAPRRPQALPGARLRAPINRNSKKSFNKLSRGGAQRAARSHLSKPQKEAPRCSYSRSAIKVSLSCLKCRKPKKNSTPQTREAHFWPRAAQTAVRSPVFEHQKPTLWLQCGAFSSKSGTLAAEVLQKIKIDNTSNARASVFNRMGPGSHQNQNSCKSVTGAAVRRILAQKNDSRA